MELVSPGVRVFEFVTSESGIRLGIFTGILGLMAVWESWAPRRNRDVHRHVHWSNNLGLAFFNTLAIRFIAPMGAVGFAMYAESNGWGLFNLVTIPNLIAVVACVVALDLVVYGQHILFHAIPILWRLHMVHHADMEFDVTTGLRFHTIEILLSLVIKCLAILTFGAPALSVLIFEVLLNGTAMFNHSNVKIPLRIDRALRWLIVTPDMHRVHHSVIRRETNSNFGFNLPWWDFLFRTYRDQPEKGHTEMTIGLPEHRDQRVVYLHWMLVLPFIGRAPDKHSSVRGGSDVEALTESVGVGPTGPRTVDIVPSAVNDKQIPNQYSQLDAPASNPNGLMQPNETSSSPP